MNYWLMQSNPEKFRIVEYYRSCPNDVATWHSAFLKRMKVRKGDKIFCWKAKGREKWRGIIGLEEAISDTGYGIRPKPHEEPFYRSKSVKKRLQGEMGFETKPIKAIPNNPITEGELREDPDLGTLSILNTGFLQKAIFEVDQELGKKLEEEIRNRSG